MTTPSLAQLEARLHEPLSVHERVRLLNEIAGHLDEDRVPVGQFELHQSRHGYSWMCPDHHQTPVCVCDTRVRSHVW